MTARRTSQRGRIERTWRAAGKIVAGVDEVGRGCLAGPVMAGCAVLDFARLARLKPTDRRLIRDSKLLSQSQRRYVIPIIKTIAIEWHVAGASVAEIESIGILQASFLAMRRALQACSTPVDVVLVDGKLKIAGYKGEQQAIVKGDNLCFTIAAASILAKEARDDYMRDQAQTYPNYGFASHVGYGTRQHLASIHAHGICTLHRRNFEPIRSLIDFSLPPQKTSAVGVGSGSVGGNLPDALRMDGRRTKRPAHRL